MTRRNAIAVLAAVVVTAATAFAAGQKDVNPQAARLKDFNDRVAKYVEIHKKADGLVPSLKRTDDPAEIASREKALGEAIRALRNGARQGELFTPEVSAHFRKMIRNDVRQRGPAAARAMMTEVPTDFRPQINATYPTTKPLATVPPLLIAALQTLPEQLEYRFFGHTLILRDVKANIIVDFVPDAIPALK